MLIKFNHMYGFQYLRWSDNTFWSWLERWNYYWLARGSSCWCPNIVSLDWHKLVWSDHLVETLIVVCLNATSLHFGRYSECLDDASCFAFTLRKLLNNLPAYPASSCAHLAYRPFKIFVVVKCFRFSESVLIWIWWWATSRYCLHSFAAVTIVSSSSLLSILYLIQTLSIGLEQHAMQCNRTSLTWKSTTPMVALLQIVFGPIWCICSQCFQIQVLVTWSLKFWNSLAHSCDHLYGILWLRKSVIGFIFIANSFKNLR